MKNIQPNYLLQAINLSCSRQNKILFTDLSFQIQSGEVLLIEGPNGSGKSSLLRLLTGLATPVAGQILWHNKTIQHVHAEYWQHLHYISHANGIKLGLTVIENLQLAAILSAETQSSCLASVLALLRLDGHKNTLARFLSAGQKRRLALARLFLIPKPLWILDEPSTALDIDMQTWFLAQLEKHAEQGGMAIVSSHHALHFTAIQAHRVRLDAC